MKPLEKKFQTQFIDILRFVKKEKDDHRKLVKGSHFFFRWQLYSFPHLTATEKRLFQI